jgi:stage II sporulation protein D
VIRRLLALAVLFGASASPSAKPAPLAPPPLPDPNDRLEQLYGRKQLRFGRGAPIVTVMLSEGQREVVFVPQGRLRLQARGGLAKTLEAPAGTTWTIRLTGYEPADVGYAVQVAELRWSNKQEVEDQRRLWAERGFALKDVPSGSLFGIAGHVLDNRRHNLLLSEPLSEEKARELLKDLHGRFGVQGALAPSLESRPRGLLEIVDSAGAVLAVAQDLVSATSPDGGSFLVKDVEHARGYAWHGRQDRTYRGDLEFAVDRFGGIAVINALPLETYLRGIVASEIPAKAPAEALKAQAVAARGEVLAKLGTRHLIDPYLLCAEQHCQVYAGKGNETAATDAAISATAGEALFAPGGGPLVDSVYSAVCGGHTENYDAVWGGPGDPMLRGRPDLLEAPPAPLAGGVSDENLPEFLAHQAPAYCALSSLANPKKYRWERRFSAAEVDELFRPFGLGHVQAMAVQKRGVSGRAVLLQISGEEGATQVRGELNIRRLFKNLNSALFQLEAPSRRHPSEWVFRGAGWGHGAGMCQVGAIGRAERGQTYREILRHYFNGAEIVRIY